jgi:O-acetyl-ADP-ribose deacetylase (regulator of RNase III)
MSTANEVQHPFGAKLNILAKNVLKLPSSEVQLFALGGSILDFHSDDGCIVNAANEGGITGFGIDELINRAGGYEMKESRRKFGGIPTGGAKSTPSFDFKNVPFVIHACGPVLRRNAFSKTKGSKEDQLAQLSNAYRSSLDEAQRLQLSDIGFCLLSAGVFRGDTPLGEVIGAGLIGIHDFIQSLEYEKSALTLPKRVAMVGYTNEEKEALILEFSRLSI